MANCSFCGVSNLGADRMPLVIVDYKWFCEDCLPRRKGHVRCSRCGAIAFRENVHFKSVDGQVLCTRCMEEAGITDTSEYIMETVAKTVAPPPTTAPGNQAAERLGGLRMLLDQHMSPGEIIAFAAQGNAGEALACTDSHVYVLKSGLAVGSITGRKCSRYAWRDIRSIELKAGSLYGLLEIRDGLQPSYDVGDITKAKRADNAVTFLLHRKKEFDKVLSLARLRGKSLTA